MSEYEVGQIDGRLLALENRVDRNETAVWQKLDSMDAKLDAMSVSLAARGGKGEGLSNAGHWIVTILALILSAVATMKSVFAH